MKTQYPKTRENSATRILSPNLKDSNGEGLSFLRPTLAGYLAALGDRRLFPAALRVALVVGTLLFAINHGPTLVRGRLTRARVLSGLLTYVVPYCVNIHGQYVSRLRRP